VTVDVAVVGAGVIGLAIAWRLRARGLTVEVHDPDPGRGASHVAAGMLAPVAETTFGEAALAALLADSAGRWPAFAAELTGQTGLDVGYRGHGTLAVATTADDLAAARRLWEYQQDLIPKRPAELRELEPGLSPRLRGGALASADHQVDPRRVLSALRVAVGPVARTAVHDLSRLNARTIVVAAGCGTAALTGLPVRPVKGQILRLRGTPAFRHVLRGYVDGRQVYLVPRADGEVVVGATVEERADSMVTAGAVLDLLRAAVELVPELQEFELMEVVAGHRPATPDNAPIIGRLDDDVVVAAGHYRHGVVLAPVTADLVADVVTGGTAPAAFDPGRFACV
jgi:glycine oxidase